MDTDTQAPGRGRRNAAIAAAFVAVAAAVVVWRSLSSDDADPERAPADAPARAAPRSPAARGFAQRTPRRHSTEPERDLVAEAQGAWDAALALWKAGRPFDALAAIGRARGDSPDFFAEASRARTLDEIEQAALAAVARAARGGNLDEARRLARLLADAAIYPTRLARAQDIVTAAERRGAGGSSSAEAGVVARAERAEDKGQLTRHLQRFGGEGAEPETKDWVDAQLAAVAAAETAAAERTPAPPLAVPDPPAVEVRRLDQLEKLRQREAVQLLDHIGGALAWLALHQADDGHFGADVAAVRCKTLGHAPVCVAQQGEQHPLAATGLVVLAFLDFRDQDARGLFEPALARATRWLVAQQDKDGSFKGPERAGYSPAIALMALGQAAASSGDEHVRDAVTRGLAFYGPNAGKNGGFRYRLGDEGDLSVTGWYVQAVEAAGAAGVEVAPELRANLDRFLGAVSTDFVSFGYLAGAGAQTAPGSLAPVGMLSTSILRPDAMKTLGDAWRKALAGAVPQGNLYGLYYGVRMLLALDGRLPDDWRAALDSLAKGQTGKGPAAGMLLPGGDGWILGAGPVVATAFAALTLEHSLYRR